MLASTPQAGQGTWPLRMANMLSLCLQCRALEVYLVGSAAAEMHLRSTSFRCFFYLWLQLRRCFSFQPLYHTVTLISRHDGVRGQGG